MYRRKVKNRTDAQAWRKVDFESFDVSNLVHDLPRVRTVADDAPQATLTE